MMTGGKLNRHCLRTENVALNLTTLASRKKTQGIEGNYDGQLLNTWGLEDKEQGIRGWDYEP
ncbi:hypothetical protein OK016_26655 [Vibrio chagasii]|nr:hypothetical protein [Vibrio chagasii]